ncbi:precorrin-3B synthase [Actinoplanes sp. TBRC 11911]|uniref:precorrin-3B synthase n=1 Tax=Actinoplanes sp. TBRC 11911 TaxID=2729386 RepID=UPI0028985857|nr:precorrin-3B synthase [Actinoplanes sp. TBRC 11911]
MTHPVRVRRSDVDACPGALRLHAAADGPLARVRVPGGMLTGAQIAALADVARAYGDGWLELTSRANVQLRAVNRGTPAALAAQLWSAGLLPSEAHETVRNIAAPPLAGSLIRSLVRALDEGLCGEPALAALPGRFLFAIHRVAVDADVAVAPTDAVTPTADVASAPDAALTPDVTKNPLFAVFLGNVDSGLRVPADQVVPAMLAAAHAFLTERAADNAAERPAWRLRELPDGPARVARRTAEALGLRRTASSAVRPPSSAERTPIGVVEQGDGLFAVGALVPLGRLGGPAVDLLAGADHVVVTTARGIVVRDLSAAAAQRWQRDLAAVGLEVDQESRWTGVTACAGRPGCAKALADVRADAEATTSHVDGLPVHWVGCARGCGSPSGAHVRVEATADGYLVGDIATSMVELGEVVAGARRR